MIEHLPALIPVSLILFAFLAGFLRLVNPRLSRYSAILGALTAFVFSIVVTIDVLKNGSISYHFGNWPPPYGIEFVLDTLTCFMVLVITGIGSTLLMFPTKPGFMIDEQQQSPLYTLVLLLLTGLCGMVLSGDLFNVYVFMEISSLTTFALVSLGGPKAAVASFRYLIMASIGACCYLLGLGFIFFTVGSVNMADVLQLLPAVYDSPSIIGGALLMITGLGLKMALFPFHTWLPDAHSYAPPIVAALLAAVQIETSAYVAIRLLLSVFTPALMSDLLPITQMIGWLGAAGIIFGSVMAIAQTNFKRMLAYSTVAQVGFVTLGLGLANPLGMVGGILHILAHALMKSCLFLVAGGISHHSGITNIQDFQGLGRRMPWTMAAFTVAAFSMIGIPPTAGFFSKWYLLLGSLDNNNWVFLVVILASTLLNAIYFFRLIEKIYSPGNAQAGAETQSKDLPTNVLVPIIILAVAILLMGAVSVWLVNNLLMPVVGGL